MGEYAEYGFDQQGWYGVFVACGIWCLADVSSIYCITCTLCNKLYIGESGRKLGDRFREHLLDVKNKGSDLSKPISIFRATRTNTWKFAEFTYTLGTMKLEKGKNRD